MRSVAYIFVAFALLLVTCSAIHTVQVDSPRNVPVPCASLVERHPSIRVVIDHEELGWCTVVGELPFHLATLLGESDFEWSVPEPPPPTEAPVQLSPQVAQPSDSSPSDPLWHRQWGPQALRAHYAWQYSPGNPDVVIAIIDTGIDRDHPELAGKVIDCFDRTPDSNDCNDVYGHGTHVAGIAAAPANGIGIVGVAPKVHLIAIKALNDEGSGSVSGIADGIVESVRRGAHVINMSLGGANQSSIVDAALNFAERNGVVVVAAAGNAGHTIYGGRCLYPANHETVLCVGAVDSQGERPYWSNEYPDVAAPGVSILSTTPGSNYESWNGTSMATPHVAGQAALYLSLNPDATPAEVRLQIVGTVRPMRNCERRFCGAGHADALLMFEQKELRPTPTLPGDPSATAYPPPPTTTPEATPTPFRTQTPAPTHTPTVTPTPRRCGDLGYINVHGTEGVDFGLALAFMLRSPTMCDVTPYPNPEGGGLILLGRCPDVFCEAYKLLFEDWGYEVRIGPEADWMKEGWIP